MTLSHDGQFLPGLGGDTVAATLLAHGRHLVARSFKYHRPRGILASGKPDEIAANAEVRSVYLGEGGHV